MVKVKQDETQTASKQSKKHGLVFSTENPASKMADLLAEKSWTPRLLRKGETVEGTIVALLPDSVLVDIGTKAEGILPLKELTETPPEKVKIGEKISAVVAQPEGDSGVAILTARRSPKDKVWETLADLAENEEPIKVAVVGANRGGIIAEYQGVRGFIPTSHLVTNAKQALGKELKVKIIQIDKTLNKLVFSEKEKAETAKVMVPFKIGEDITVTVVKILPFGLLVSTPDGPEGLVHISEISWKKVESLEKMFKVGDTLKCRVISIDESTRKINLSLKQLEEDPWKAAAEKYKVGTPFEGKVTRGTSYGTFVELEEGIEGLLHSSKIPYGVAFKEGDKVRASIDLFNAEQRRVALRLATPTESKDNIKSEANNKRKTKEKTIKVKTKKSKD